MPKRGANISLSSYDDIFSTEESRADQAAEKVQEIPLAKHYLRNTDMSSDEIAFLLGYQEINSFLRAFSIWTGMSITEFRASQNL